MNEYACYGKGHTIHSSGQIEWFKNSVDDRSVQVGGKQRICTIDGYAMPLTCRGGLMYLSVKIFDIQLRTNDQSRPHGIETTGLTTTQKGLELPPRIPSRLHKTERY